MNQIIFSIQKLIGNDIISTIVMSFMPLIELKGGIIFARGINLSILKSFGLAFLGSTCGFFVMFFLLKPVLKLLKKLKWFKSFANNVENYFKVKATETLSKQTKLNRHNKNAEIFIKQLAVLVFVAIPLPMTGVWAGTAIAVFLDLKLREAILPIAIGNLIAGAIISIIASICERLWGIQSLNTVLWVLFGIALILFLICIFKILFGKSKKVEGSCPKKEED